jgi:hypothetical protein
MYVKNIQKYIYTKFGHLSYLGNFRFWEYFTLGNFRWETFVWASFVWETFVAPYKVIEKSRFTVMSSYIRLPEGQTFKIYRGI